MRIDYAIFLLAIVFFVFCIYLTVMSSQVQDLSLRVQLLALVTVLFILGVFLIIVVAIVFLSKKMFLKPK